MKRPGDGGCGAAVKAGSWKMQAALSVQAAIAPFRLPGTLTRRARPPVFPPSGGGGEPGADGTDHPNLTQPARRRGSALQSWPDSGMNRLHRIGGTWGRRRCRAQARHAPSRDPGHFHGVPIPSVPLVTPGSRLRKKHGRRTPTAWIGYGGGWRRSEPGCTCAGC